MRNINEINTIIANMEDKTFEKLNYWFDQWFFEKAPKARFNYWLKKAGITEEEYWMWSAE